RSAGSAPVSSARATASSPPTSTEAARGRVPPRTLPETFPRRGSRRLPLRSEARRGSADAALDASERKDSTSSTAHVRGRMKTLKILGALLGALLLIAVGSFLYAKRAAAQRLDRDYAIEVATIPIPFPLTADEIAALRREKASTGGSAPTGPEA